MAFRKMNMQPDLFITPIPNGFIDDYIPKARHAFVVVYIVGYRYWYQGQYEISNETLAETLGLLSSEVKSAWKYWEEQKLVVIHESENDTKDYEVEFLLFEQDMNPSLKVVKKEKNGTKTPEELSTSKTTPTPSLETKPTYTVSEIDAIAQRNEDARHLFHMAEKMFAKPLSYNEMNALIGMYEWLNLPLEVIEVMLDYCLSNNHKGMRYIEKVAIDWADNEIQTAKEAEEYVKLFNQDYREIMKTFGLARREPSPKEISFMKKWIRDWKMPIPIIVEACNKTIMALAQPNFAYTDTIVKEWHEQDVKTSEDIQRLEEEFKRQSSSPKQSANIPKSGEPRKYATKKPLKTKFSNYEERSLDFDALAKKEMSYLDQLVEKIDSESGE